MKHKGKILSLWALAAFLVLIALTLTTATYAWFTANRQVQTDRITGEITLPEGVEMVMPGDHVEIIVDLINPVACDKGLRFAIREGGRTVGSGQITEILD